MNYAAQFNLVHCMSFFIELEQRLRGNQDTRCNKMAKSAVSAKEKNNRRKKKTPSYNLRDNSHALGNTPRN